MPETLTKDGGSPLSFGSPGPQKVSKPYIKVKNSKLSYKAHHVLIQKLLKAKLICDIHNTLLPIFYQIRLKTKMTILVIVFTMNVFKSIGNRTFWFI